jgi:hypothetical protein
LDSPVFEGLKCIHIQSPLKNGKIAANLPQYCQTFAIYMEGLLPFTIKMSMNGKHEKWNKTKKKKKKSGIPFHFGKITENS